MYTKARIGDLVEVMQGLNTSGRGVGARQGDWVVKEVSAGDIQNDAVSWDQLSVLRLQETERIREYLLKPNDLLLTSRSTSVKAALVPPDVEDTVAVGSLLVLRERDEHIPAAHYLWLYFTSDRGRSEVASLMTGATIQYLAPRAISQMEVPMPPVSELWKLVDLVEASEDAYRLALQAAEERRLLAHRIVTDRLFQAEE